MKCIQNLLAVLECKNLIRTFVSQFLSCIRIDVAHHEINLFLCILANIGSLRNDPADQLMVVFAAAFLIRSTGVAVKHLSARIPLGIQFDSGRIRKLTSVITVISNSV